jgi:hypothetical protein
LWRLTAPRTLLESQSTKAAARAAAIFIYSDLPPCKHVVGLS